MIYVVKLISFTRMAVTKMSKDLSISVLMDFYSELLTDKQRDTMEMYYNQDYSLAEIAEHFDISRQGVRDFIKRGEKQLYEFEEKLGMVKKYNTISNHLKNLEEILNITDVDTLSFNKTKAMNILKNIKDVL